MMDAAAAAATTGSMKPRTRSSNNRTGSTSSTSNHNNDAATDGDDDKAAKVQKTQDQKLRHFVLFFILLSAVAFIVATQHESSTHIHHHTTTTTTTTTSSSSSSNGNNVVVSAAAVQQVQQQEQQLQQGGPTLEHLQRTVDALDAKVRAHKSKPGVIMEQDPEGMKLTKELQHVTHQLLVKRYGRHTFRVRVDLIFPEVIVKKDGLLPAKAKNQDFLVLELAPIDLIPCSVYYFLEIARTWKSGAFHRNANHVLQVATHAEAVKKSMPFQEYSPEYPHAKGTVGYAGRPSGPGWYISIMDNTVNHGPGSQQNKNPYEADSLFGRVVNPGMDTVVPRIHSTPQVGWLDKEHQIVISKMTILIQEKKKNSDGNVVKEWVPWTPLPTDAVAA